MEKISFTITTYCDSKAPFRNRRRRSKREIISRHGIRGVLIMRKKHVLDWLSAMLSMVFYIGLFGGIGYLIQVLIL
jgi:hypothetical protein